MEGILLYDHYAERFYIKTRTGEIRHLHCGDCLNVFVRNKWVQTRIELNHPNDWYLVDLEEVSINNLPVFMQIVW